LGFVDITERKRMEQILRNDEEEYRMLAESITDVFFALDKDLRYTYWNKASEDLTGISAKDAIGKSFYELFPDMKGTRAEEVYLEVLRTGQSRSFVNEYKLEGKQFFFEINAYPTKWGISVFTKDITERKRAEIELRAAKERLEYVVTSNPAVIFSAKPRADYSDYNISYMSDRVVEMLGFEPRQFIGHPEFWDGRVHHAGVLLRGGSAELQTDRKATIRPTVVRACDLPS